MPFNRFANIESYKKYLLLNKLIANNNSSYTYYQTKLL